MEAAPLEVLSERRLCADVVMSALHDLASSYETGLRTILMAQRLLERVRCGDRYSLESELLLQELARHLGALKGSIPDLTRQLEVASDRLAAFSADCAEA